MSRQCPNCWGTGMEAIHIDGKLTWVKCRTCGGSGKV